MLFTDIMNDINSGDVNIHDVYAEEATQQINVASSIFEYAMTLIYADGVSSDVVQEAADAEGLPTDTFQEAAELACDSVVKELTGFYSVVVSNAKKVKTATDRDLKAIIGLGKKYGVSAPSGDFTGTFAKPIAQAMAREYGKGKSISFVNGVFPAAGKTHDLSIGFGNAMARLAAVFGISVSGAASDPTVKKQLSLGGTGGERATDVSDLYKMISKGTIFTKIGTTGEIKSSSSASTSDIADVITYLYVVNQIAGAVAANAGTAKQAENFLATLCKGNGSSIKKLNSINDKVKGWADAVNTASTTIVKAFSDAAAALGNIAQGKTKGITEYCVEGYTELDVDDDVFVSEADYENSVAEDDQVLEAYFAETHHRKTGWGALAGAGAGLAAGAVAGLATGGVGLLAAPLLASLGALAGNWVGMASWRNTPAAEMIKFIQDVSDKLEKRKGKLGERVQRLADACSVCMNVSDKFSKSQMDAIKALYGETENLAEQSRSLGQVQTGQYPYPAAGAIESWIKAADRVKKELEAGPANGGK